MPGKDENKTTEAEEQKEKEPKASEPEPKDEGRAKPKYSDDDMDQIVARAIAKERKRSEDKMAEEKARITEAQKLEKMNEQEKAAYELKKLKEENAKLQAQMDLAEQKRVARGILDEVGIVINDGLLDMIVSPDAEKTKASVDEFKTQFQAAVNKGVQDALKRPAPEAESKKRNNKGTSYGADFARMKNEELVPHEKKNE